jgi:phosphatidylserine/phosphatidylglycerophosphate/cardiolipin synthase-like enzyme
MKFSAHEIAFPKRLAGLILLVLPLASCTVAPRQAPCPAGTQDLPGCPPLSAIEDPEISQLHADRAWLASREIEQDLINLGKTAEIPVQHARTKYLGPDDHGAIDSLAVKLWMIENAEHTIDFTYYIFKTDLIGYAMVGAMCNAVKRGVDVRVTVDSLGSISGMSHPALRALESCGDQAGFMRTADGRMTNRRARVQVVIFNAVSTPSNPNRRSHDKLLVKDGSFENKSAVITGGRNISEDYYGIRADGSADPDPFRDAEILIRSKRNSVEEDITVGELSEVYSTILFLLDFNRRLRPANSDSAAAQYRRELRKAQESLRTLKGYAYFRPHMEEMEEYMNSGFRDSEVRFAHELGNLTDRRVVTEAEQNLERNPNSIMTILRQIGEQMPELRQVRMVSPYLFLAEYRNRDGELVRDEAKNFRAWLEEHPEATIEIITNSVLTSDNFPAQSVIDMETAPRLLLPPEMREEWLNLSRAEERTSALVNSEEWKALVNHPRLAVYETGRLDSVKLGGDSNYGKLHAKFFISEDLGFVGTTNFDYRSRLYNNEMGFFFLDPELAADLHASFEELILSSYRWGTPEWFEMRQRVVETGGMKGWSTQGQRGWYKFFKKTGIIWWL